MTTTAPPERGDGDRSPAVTTPVCVPRRFSSAAEALRSAAGVLLRGHLLGGAYAGGLDAALRERVMVAVSEVNSCQGCTRAHRGWALRAGVTIAELEALRERDLDRLDPRSRAAVSYAVDRATGGFDAAPAAEARRHAAAHFSARELAQIEAVARAMALANLSLNTISARTAR